MSKKQSKISSIPSCSTANKSPRTRMRRNSTSSIGKVNSTVKIQNLKCDDVLQMFPCLSQMIVSNHETNENESKPNAVQSTLAYLNCASDLFADNVECSPNSVESPRASTPKAVKTKKSKKLAKLLKQRRTSRDKIDNGMLLVTQCFFLIVDVFVTHRHLQRIC